MTPRSEARVLTAVLTALVALAAISTAWLGPAARRMPLIVALPTLALLAIEWWRPGRGGGDAAAVPIPGEGALLVWLVGLVGATWALGVLLGPPLFLAAYLRRRSRERSERSLPAGRATAAG